MFFSHLTPADYVRGSPRNVGRLLSGRRAAAPHAERRDARGAGPRWTSPATQAGFEFCHSTSTIDVERHTHKARPQ